MMVEYVRCDTCNRFVEKDRAHDMVGDDGIEYFWCSPECCPVCRISEELLDAISEQLTLEFEEQ